MLEKITQLLSALGGEVPFTVRRTMPARALRLFVDGVGDVSLPVSPASARALIGAAQPARYGLKSDTLLDPKVRNTWEIEPACVRLARGFAGALKEELAEIARALRLPLTARLRAELHALLVYEPGQFFVAHQDSEKADAMIGTLVVVLPSKFSGGALVVEHRGERVVHGNGGVRADELALIAFYADCHHEVRPIKSGHRVVLTYDLLLEGEALRLDSEELARPVDALERELRAYFAAPRPTRAWQAEGESPDRLAYLLDHEYSQRGLSWKRLKGLDAVRAGALRDAAARLDCQVFLALADVHESWQCEYEEWGGRGWRGAAPERDPEDYGLVELLESSVELRHWIGTNDRRVEPISDAVAYDEVCSTSDSADLRPFRSEHEGYMGNWGNTVDHWYHRAAIVLWPRANEFVIRAKASPEWGVSRIEETLRAQDRDQALALARALLPFWPFRVGADASAVLRRRVLKVAAKLGDAESAAALLAPFSIGQLVPADVPSLLLLLEQHGRGWCERLIGVWMKRRARTASSKWLVELPEICGRLAVQGSREARQLASWLCSTQWKELKVSYDSMLGHLALSARLGAFQELARPLLALLECALITGVGEVREEILALLIGPGTQYPSSQLGTLLETAWASYPGEALGELGLGPVYTACVGRLTAALSASPRASDDWSIPAPRGCACELCQRLAAFLVASHETRLEWPLAKERRAHIHHVLDQHELPVTHATRRMGSPYTLVLTKMAMLFERDEEQRRAWAELLERLVALRDDFVPSAAPASKPRSRDRSRADP